MAHCGMLKGEAQGLCGALMRSRMVHSFGLKECTQRRTWPLQGHSSKQGRGKGSRSALFALGGNMEHFQIMKYSRSRLQSALMRSSPQWSALKQKCLCMGDRARGEHMSFTHKMMCDTYQLIEKN